jgi:hypothetical protein
MEPLKDIAAGRVHALHRDGRLDELSQVQHELDRLYSGKARAVRIDTQTNQLFIHVQSATLATIVRYAQVQILTSIKDICKPPIERLVIQIRHSS